MKSLEQYLQEVAKEKQYANFETLTTCVRHGNTYVDTLTEVITEAMQRAIEDACREQREICANEAQAWKNDCYDGGSHCGHPTVDKDSILNAPSPIYKQNK